MGRGLLSAAAFSVTCCAYYLRQEVLWSDEFVGWFVCSFVTLVVTSRKVWVGFGMKSGTDVRQISLLRSRSNFKVISFLREPSATATTKRKQVHARSMSSYLGRVIAVAAFGFESNHSIYSFMVIDVCNCCAPMAASLAAWRRFALSINQSMQNF